MKAAVIALACVLAAGAAQAQITAGGQLQQQLTPDSFKLTASAIASPGDSLHLGPWNTTISYSLTNNAGMNLYMGITEGGVSIGRCGQLASAEGGLQVLRMIGAGQVVWYAGGPAPRPRFVPAGGTVSGTVVMRDCKAPNPGSATAPVSIVFVMGTTPRADHTDTDSIQLPLTTTASIRQVQ